MSGPRGANYVLKGQSKVICGMYSVGVLPKVIFVCYRLARIAVSAIIRHSRHSAGQQTREEKGRPKK